MSIGYFDFVQPIVKRKVMIYIPNSIYEKYCRTNNRLIYKISQFNECLKKHLEELAKESKIPIMRVALNYSTWPCTDTKDLWDKELNPSNTRILIDFAPTDDSEHYNQAIKHNVSHIVIANVYSSSDTQVCIQQQSYCAYLPIVLQDPSHPNSFIDEILTIITDVLLDICMYHTYINENVDLGKQRIFSKFKVEYIRSKLRSAISDIWDVDSDLGYISIAGMLRKDGVYDYKEYIKHWENIRTYYIKIQKRHSKNRKIVEKQVQCPESLSDEESLIEQFKMFKFKGELSFEKIYKIYTKLKPGSYILLFLHRIPHKAVAIRALEPLFKGTKLKRGKITIIPVAAWKRYSCFKNNLRVYPLWKN